MSESETLYGPWEYKNHRNKFPYDDTASYRIAGEFLSGDGATVEDWGGGVGWAEKYIHDAKYVLVDGTWSKWCDKQVDLRTYRTEVDRIMMRHVLEHNREWRTIAQNFTDSYTQRAALILFVPFSETGEEWDQFDGETAVPDMHLVREELEAILTSNGATLEFQELTDYAPNDTIQYRWEGVYLLQR